MILHWQTVIADLRNSLIFYVMFYVPRHLITNTKCKWKCNCHGVGSLRHVRNNQM